MRRKGLITIDILIALIILGILGTVSVVTHVLQKDEADEKNIYNNIVARENEIIQEYFDKGKLPSHELISTQQKQEILSAKNSYFYSTKHKSRVLKSEVEDLFKGDIFYLGKDKSSPGEYFCNANLIVFFFSNNEDLVVSGSPVDKTITIRPN